MDENKIVIDYEKAPFKDSLKANCYKLPSALKMYLFSFFPIFQWITKYNTEWLIQDMIAGITVGIVIVPQGMAYAKVANLDPQYGLYTSFVGAVLYCFFGTSKDISMGPISTVSLLVGSAITTIMKTDPTITPAEVGNALAIFSGIVCVVISVVRLGALVDFIPEPAIAGYMTGSAITIVMSQWPKLFGIPDVRLHEPPYIVLAEVLVRLPLTSLDVAFGLAALVFLYGIKYACGRISCRSPKLQKAVFLFGIMRNGIIVIVGTLICFLINISTGDSPVSIIRSVPAGFDSMGIPNFDFNIIRQSGSLVPSIVLILVLEHISVAKSFGRINDYSINPDQEIMAIGISNIVGSFFGGYPLTGAFSRTAIMARSGVKTPFAGVFAGAVVILALYVLTPAFYYIPEAILAAVVIHAVIDLVSKMSYIKGLWYTNKAELLVWISAVLVTVFVDVQTGIYAAVGLSLVIMLYNLTKPPVKVLARLSPDEKTSLNDYESKMESKVEEGSEDYMYADETDPNFATYIKELPRGIVCIKPCGPILYPNAEYISDKILRIVKRKTKPGNMTGLNEQSVNRPWSEEIPSQMEAMKMETLPVLRALLFDFGAVCRIDSTGLGMLVTLRDTVARHAGQTVEFHFSHLQGSSVREGLLRSGFGSLPCDTESIDSTSEYGISYSSSAPPPPSPSVHEKSTNKENSSSYSVGPIESAYPTPYKSLCKHVMQTPIDRYPCFHWNTNTAVQDICHRWSQSGKHESLDSAMI